MNKRIHLSNFLLALFLPVLITSSCSTPSDSPSEKTPERFPAYRVDEIRSSPRTTSKDRKLANLIREHQTEDVTPLQEIERQSRIVEYMQTLSEKQIVARISGTGKVLASAMKGNTLPKRFFGRWYRLRGTPISEPDNDPFQGHLNVNTSVQQFTVKNPADFDDPSQRMYYVILTLDPLPSENVSEVILEMDGLLWNTWDISAITTSSAGKTPQSEIPVLFVKNLRYVEK